MTLNDMRSLAVLFGCKSECMRNLCGHGRCDDFILANSESTKQVKNSVDAYI